MMKPQWVLVLLMMSCVFGAWNIQENLATRTPYWSQGSREPSPTPEGCNLVHLDLVSRHGARNPTNGDVTALTKLADSVKNYNAYISDNFGWIKNWTNPFVAAQQGYLSFSGQEELFYMGHRYNSTYSPLFSQQYFPDVYVMQSTQVPRTGVSASSFAQGYLQGLGRLPNNFLPPYIFSNTAAYDYLRFFDNCEEYVQAMKNGTINEDEAEAYSQANYPAIAARVAAMLGVNGIWNISNDVLDSMFTACAFEVAVFNKTDGWCAIFSPSDISVYVYVSDLEDYWTRSYGTALGYKIGSVVLQNVVSTIDAVINGSSPTQKAYLRFAHAETILPLYAVLGLYKDNFTLTANLTQDQIDSRVWTTSVIAPFAGNLAFSLYSCGGSDYKIKLTTNEVETQMPGCGGEMYCPYTTFKSIYADALAFNFTRACENSLTKHTKHTITRAELAIGIVVAFIFGASLVLVGAVVYFRRTYLKYVKISTHDISTN
jgi:multiple inositol-polyphosphate phosphatase/2,3-bisphosphoglycerate 3-phosphatase